MFRLRRQRRDRVRVRCACACRGHSGYRGPFGAVALLSVSNNYPADKERKLFSSRAACVPQLIGKPACLPGFRLREPWPVCVRA